MIEQQVIDRFCNYIDKREDGCWAWTGPKTKNGLGGRMIVGTKEYQARRLSYEIHVGPTERGKGIRVSCDNEMCVSPDHLLHGDAALFWSKVDRNGPTPDHRQELGSCWIWTAATNDRGYGTCQIVKGQQLAHRAAWVLENGSLTDGDCILHRCDNPPCVRPDHLFIGDVPINNADRHAKERDGRGEKDRHAKLTEAIVRDIRARGRLPWADIVELALEHGVSNMTIWSVSTGRSWKHVA